MKEDAKNQKRNSVLEKDYLDNPKCNIMLALKTFFWN